MRKSKKKKKIIVRIRGLDAWCNCTRSQSTYKYQVLWALPWRQVLQAKSRQVLQAKSSFCNLMEVVIDARQLDRVMDVLQHKIKNENKLISIIPFNNIILLNRPIATSSSQIIEIVNCICVLASQTISEHFFFL